MSALPEPLDAQDVDDAETMLRDAPCGIVSTLPDGRIVRCNRTFERWIGSLDDPFHDAPKLHEMLGVAGRLFFETHVRPMLVLQGHVREISLRLDRPGRAPLPILLNARARTDARGTVVRHHYTLFDATERSLYEAELRGARARAEELAALVTASPDAIFGARPDGTITSANPGAQSLLRLPAERIAGRPIGELLRCAALSDWFGTARNALEREPFVRFDSPFGDASDGSPDGSSDGASDGSPDAGRTHWRDIEITVSRIEEPGTLGELAGVSIVVRDVSARLRAERHLRLVAGELNHRVKNTLAVVSAIASRSFPRALRTGPAVGAFRERLRTLGAAHDLLTREGWEPIELASLVHACLGALPDGHRIVATGPPVMLPSSRTTSLALALHELATNAVKHGALSVPDGRVSIAWRLDAAATWLELEWCERGGPRVEPPATRGFGSTMIEAALASDFEGSATLTFEPEGVRYRLEGRVREHGCEGDRE